MRYRVLKEFLTVKNPRWLNPGEIIDGQPNGARIKALLEKGYIEEIPEQPKTVWDLEEGDIYFYISMDGCIEMTYWAKGSVAEEARECGNCFVTKEEAEKELAHRKAKQILLRDTKGFKPDWGNHQQSKYIVYIHHCRNILAVDYWCDYHSSLIYFANEDDAEESIKHHPNEWKTYLGVEE